MSELFDVQEEKTFIKIKGTDRELKFNFSAWANIEKEIGDISKIEEVIEQKPFETIPKLIYYGLVDKSGVTKENCLDDYGLSDIDYLTDIFNRAISKSLPQDDGKKAEMEAEK